MGKELFNAYAESKSVFEIASKATSVDVAQLCFDTPEEVLRQTENAQLALYTCGVAAFKCFQRHVTGMVRIDAVAGHSVGELAASVACGMLSVEDGARLVRKRGELMAAAGKSVPGTMAAVIGLDRADLERALKKAAGTVVIANDNSPGQLVISGEIDAVKEAGQFASEAGAKRVIPLNVSGAFHSPLMAEAAAEFAEFAQGTVCHERADVGPMYSNATAEAIGRESDLPKRLVDVLAGPVRWTELIQNMARDGFTTYLEFGTGDVLCGLIRRIDREAKTVRIDTLETLENAVASLRP